MADSLVFMVSRDEEGMFRFTTPQLSDVGSAGYGVILAELARGIAAMIEMDNKGQHAAILDSIVKTMLREIAMPMAAEEKPSTTPLH